MLRYWSHVIEEGGGGGRDGQCSLLSHSLLHSSQYYAIGRGMVITSTSFLKLFSNISGFTECALIILQNVLFIPDLSVHAWGEEKGERRVRDQRDLNNEHMLLNSPFSRIKLK